MRVFGTVRSRLTEPAPGYAVAIGGVGGVVGFSVLMTPWLDNTAPVLLLAVVVIAGWIGGGACALLAAITGLLALDFFFETPANSLVIADPQTAVDVAVFLGVALLLGSLNSRSRDSLRRAEEAREAAEAAIRARDESLAVVSHDLRTTVTAVQASVAALQEDESRLPAPTRFRLLRNIQSDADRLARFVDDALALARLEAGVAPRIVDADASEIASAVLDQCLPLLAQRPLTFDVPDDLPVLRCDPVLLERVLANVLSNIAVHTPAGTPFAMHCRPDRQYLRFEVSDAGPGIPIESRERVLQKFERGAQSSQGAGLGLALAQTAVVAQGGQMWIEESPAGGASIVILLPKAMRQ